MELEGHPAGDRRRGVNTQISFNRTRPGRRPDGYSEVVLAQLAQN